MSTSDELSIMQLQTVVNLLLRVFGKEKFDQWIGSARMVNHATFTKHPQYTVDIFQPRYSNVN